MKTHLAWTLLRRRWITVAVCAALGLIIAGGYSATLSAKYTSSSRLIVSVASVSGSGADALQNTQAAQQRLASYKALATSTAVTDAIPEPLKQAAGGNVESAIAVNFPPGTVVLDLTATTDSPKSAQDLMSAVDEQLQRLVTRVETPSGGGNPTAKLSVVDSPSPGSASGTKKPVIITLGLIVGLVIGIAIAWFRERSDRTVRTRDDLAETVGDDVVGPVATPTTVSRAPNPLSAMDSASAAAVRAVRSRMATAATQGEATVVYIAGLDVDTSGFARALAQTFADSGTTTALIDARPASAHSVTASLALTSAAGLGDVLAGAANTEDCLTHNDSLAYRVLPAGTLNAESSNRVAGHQFSSVLTDVARHAQCIIVDAAALADNPESASLSHAAAATVFAIGLGTNTVDGIRQAITPVASAARASMTVAIDGEPATAIHPDSASHATVSTASTSTASTSTPHSTSPTPSVEQTREGGRRRRTDDEADAHTTTESIRSSWSLTNSSDTHSPESDNQPRPGGPAT